MCGLFLQISLGFGQLPSAASAFRLSQLSPWLPDLLQAAGANTPVGGIPIPGPFLCHRGCTDQQYIQLGDEGSVSSIIIHTVSANILGLQ